MGKRSLFGLVEFEDKPPPSGSTARVSESGPAPQSSAPVRAPAASGPMVVSSLIPGATAEEVRPRRASAQTAPASSSPSKRVGDLIQEVRNHVPEGNATMKLMAAMTSLETAIPDADTRRNAAMSVLQTQGVTAQAIAEGTKEVGHAIDSCLDNLLSQTNEVRERDVVAKRSEASKLRDQIDDNNRKIEEIKASNTALDRQAAELDSAADNRESELAQFKTDVEAARAAARIAYGV